MRKSAKGLKKRKGWKLFGRLTSQASHTTIGGIALDANGQAYLKVYVTAAPSHHKANKALIALLAEIFSIPKSSFRIISGLRDRHKVIWLEGDFPFELHGNFSFEALRNLTNP